MIARHEGAGMPWYRGKILSLAGTKVNLLYVDYGQTEVGKVIFGQKESYLRVLCRVCETVEEKET